MKPGYKNTEIGVIPEDWEVKTLGELGTFRGGNGFPIKYQNKKEGDFPFFKVSDLNNVSGSYGLAVANNYINEDERRAIGAKVFPLHTIVIAKVGAAIFLERKRLLNSEGCLDNNMAGLILNMTGVVDNEFILYSMLNINLGDLVSTTALPSLNGKLLSNIKIPLPPLPEQRAIATALSDIDALLAAQDRLIAKKRDLKTAAMQALLSGKQRLPGFAGAWVERKLGDCLQKIIGGGTPSRANPSFWGGDIPWVTVKDFSTFNPQCAQEYITIDGLNYSASHLIPKGTVITTTRMALGKAVRYKVDVTINQDLKALFLNNDMDEQFLVFWFKLKESYIDSLGGGSTVKGISTNTIKQFDFLKPPLDEQRAIATVLSDMDAEIEALEAQRDKTVQMKQGMMQELLTGKTRLV